MSATRDERRKIQSILQEIWSAYRRAGTTDDYEIIESLAAILVGDRAILFPPEWRPQQSHQRYTVEYDVEGRLREASKLAGEEGTLFDRYILFYSASTAKEKSIYPLPRHITDFMLRLLQVEPGHDFADFTCGTGGFLVNRDGGKNEQKGITAGIELRPEVMHLAGANAILHGMKPEHTRLYLGDAFNVCLSEAGLFDKSEVKWIKDASFNRIAMAPPFGMRVENENAVTRHWTDNRSGSLSENFFTRLALEKLAKDGRAALMVPHSLAWEETRGTPALRKWLLQNCTLQAVISLEEGMLQPFNNEKVSIFLMRNKQPTGDYPAWFFKIERDGYMATRNLLMEPESAPSASDMPLAEQALLLSEDDFQDVPTSSAINTGLAIRYIIYQHRLHGIVLKTAENAMLRTIRRFSMELSSRENTYLLIEMRNPANPTLSLVIPLTEEEISPRAIHSFSNPVDAKDQLISIFKEHGLQLNRRSEGSLLYTGSEPGQMFAIAQDGRLLGLTQLLRPAQPPETLHPAEIVPAPEEVFSTLHPARTLNAIWQDEQLVSRYIDSLQGRVEVRPIIAQKLPPRLHPIKQSRIRDLLGPEQKDIWEVILKQIDAQSHALYFTPEYIQYQLQKDSAKQAPGRAYIQQTLDLFTRMGLIVRVLITYQQKSKPLIYYRRVTELDITDLSAENQGGEREEV
jgi:type I restriction enzyme M protein